ncbi:WSC domain-containing protein [Daldinia vernicosa]|uniref:WSC domain-containing protein n=1 Tax=Daldinia vernicosa TaxID=114800 RepID=UPI0020083ECF|nr:WSC domain-containing protein [Daldinia vernicosa]KAI0845147.1 WSC domain-containing protein [Daldinia vernicosa]
MASYTCSGVLGLTMLLATAPLAVAHQSQPTCPAMPVAFGNTTISTHTTNNTLIVEADAPNSSPIPTASPRPELRIIDEDPVYKYVGCWSDVALMNPDVHSLDGPYLVKAGLMNVHVCVDFCRNSYKNKNKQNQTGYRYAGLEIGSQCWCGNNISKHSNHLTDDVCDIPCDGANTTACGGHLAITLYNMTEKKTPGDNNGIGGNGSNAGTGNQQPEAPHDQAALQAVGVGILVLAVTFALGWGCL